MIETLTIITLCVIALILFRPGKTEPLDNPLVINRVGQFHAVLAPKINLAQPLLEDISRQLTEGTRQSGNTPPQYFSVQDKEVKAHGENYYLLAATLRDGMLYFQAAAPDKNSNSLDTIRAFSEKELVRHPDPAQPTETATSALLAAMRSAAERRGAILTQLES